VRLLLILISFFIIAFSADDINSSEIYVEAPLKKVLYLNYKDVPQRVIKGEVFSITLRTLSTTTDFFDVMYYFSSYNGVDILNTTPYRVKENRYYYDTFYFIAKNKNAKLPDITAELISKNNYKTTKINGIALNVIELNPKKDFSNIISKSFSLADYRTTSYDDTHNIIVFEANATNTIIDDIHFKNVFKQGKESSDGSFLNSKITYYVVVDKMLENFSFSYFNLINNNYEYVNIPIIVDDDSVSTQTDLKPTNQSHERLKMNIAAGVAAIGFIFVLWRKKYIYLFLILVPLGYIVYLSIPQKDICIKKGSNIYLLPLYYGTIFETTSSTITLKKEGEVDKFVKVKLKNNKIGWVKNEDICSR
jgi:hypothetical protein